MKFSATFIFFSLLFWSEQILAQPGSLDNTFGTDGEVTVQVLSGDSYGQALAIEPDGKIIVAGQAGVPYYLANDFALIRLNTDGRLDQNFNGTGKVVTQIGYYGSGINSVAVQQNGKIVAGGWCSNSRNYDFALAQYNWDGSLDPAFGDRNTGTVQTDISGGDDIEYSMAIQPDSKIIEAGITLDGFAMVRYDSNGIIDSTFGINGVAESDYDIANSIAVQNDGKIVTAGSLYFSESNHFSLARYSSNGVLDSSFGVNGVVITEAGYNGKVNSIAIQPDNKIIAGGYSQQQGTFQFTIIRYEPGGTVDSSFGLNGHAIALSANSINYYCNSLALQPDGKILAAGYSQPTGNLAVEFAVVRYNSNGTLDSSFGVNGLVTTEIQSSCVANSIAIQKDGQIVVGGTGGNAEAEIAVARYNSELINGTANILPSQNTLLICPNPVTRNSVLQYALSKEEVITIGIYDDQGILRKKICENQIQSRGKHTEYLGSLSGLQAGIYCAVISSPGEKTYCELVK